MPARPHWLHVASACSRRQVEHGRAPTEVRHTCDVSVSALQPRAAYLARSNCLSGDLFRVTATDL
jgi:hypothetical protein